MQIKKMQYSAHPWRLLTDDGKEVMAPQNFSHPDLGMTSAMMPVSGATKTQCTEQAPALLDMLIRRNAAGVLL